ncbi:MAG TPA: M48 family metalloprotease, partial [Myxococcota bacterium]|nr:M48 family metalloprotease [Myxococcota bacterium]
ATAGVAQDPALNRYVESVGRAVAAHSPRQDVNYTFKIVEMDEPNAFALPGGHIFVSRGLLLLANTEAELAYVLGHEIGHVAARHAAKLDAHVKTLGLATLLGDILSGGREEEEHASETAGSNPFARYARNQERQADSIGQQIALEAGFDPGGMARFLTELDNYSKLKEGFSMPQTYWSTHPATRERMADAASRAQTEAWKHGASGATPPYEDARNAYLDKIDGMSVNRPASEGVFVEDRFFHADLGFSLRFPYGWETHNEPARVMAIAPKHDGVVLLELQGPGGDPIAAAREYAELEALPLEHGTPFHVGELPAFRAVAMVPTSFGPLNAEITWVAFNNRVYRLLGGTRGGQVSKYQGLFRKFAQSFRPITPEETASIEELRVRSARALPGETLAELSARTHNQWDLTFTSVANGVFAHEALTPGQRIKIAVKEPYQPAPAPGATPGSATPPAPPPAASAGDHAAAN